MTKVVSSYPSVVRGVSEQVPQDRLPGQHAEQVNMVSDPVRGVARRHGSIMLSEQALGIGALTTAQDGYIRNYREFSFFIDGTEYMLVYQAKERTVGDDLPFCFAVNKDTGQLLTVVTSESAAGAMDPWKFGGISAITTVGNFLVMASDSLGPGYSQVDNYAAHYNEGVAQVRGGAYSRTYQLSIKHTNGNTYTGTYTTMASSYPNLLDTSDIAASDPEYQKKVNDRVNAYNSAANKWIGDAAASVQPQNIAAQLHASIIANGYPAIHITHSQGTVYTNTALEMSSSDSGDGSLFRTVHLVVDDPAKLSTKHYSGKVVKVQPKGTEEYYYMKAVPTVPGKFDSEVQWVEAAGVTITPGQVFAIGALNVAGTTLTIADTPAQLATATGLTVPGFEASMVGDGAIKGGIPYFFGRRVTLLTVFMDRLVIVADGVVFMSRTGDYFNWFRKSMLAVGDDDPIEAFALGAEDDIITKSVTYNKDLFMFGERKQYTVSGRSLLTPKTVAISVVSNERDSVNAQPVVVGNLLFYGKYEAAPNQIGDSPFATSISQFQLGLFQDTPETFRVSQQLDKYIRGRPIELAALPSPHSVFVRTDGLDNGMYVYRFIDQAGTQTRQFDSWSRWEWDPVGMGKVIAISVYKATLFVVVIRDKGDGPWVGVEQFVMDSQLAVDPYLDSLRLPAYYEGNTGFFKHSDATQYDQLFVAATMESSAGLLGESADDYDTFKENVLEDGALPSKVGVHFDAYVDLTSPYVRDQNDKAVVNGRLVVNRLSCQLTDTGGMDAFRMDAEGTKQVLAFNGRRVGLSNNQVGMQPVSTATVPVSIGRANTEYGVKLASRTWLPFTLSGIEWVGQFFNRARRV